MTTPVSEIRATITEALLATDAADAIGHEQLNAFESGASDLPLAEFTLDSLSRMELLVALEVEHGVVVTPLELTRLSSLGELAARAAAPPSATAAQGAPSEARATEARATEARALDAPRIARVFQRAFGGCGSISQVDQTFRRFEGRMTPLEVQSFSEIHRAGALAPTGAQPKYAAALDGWIAALLHGLEQSGKSDPEPFVAQRLAPAAVLSKGPGAPQDKSLLICFSNIGGRILFVPHPVLLQHVDAKTFDVLSLFDPWGTAFRRGVPGIGRSVADVVNWVAELPQLRPYKAIRVLGASAGAYPAMLVGRRLDAEATVGLCGRFPSERHLWTLAVMHGRSIFAAMRHPNAPVMLVHGTRRRGDVTFARRLSRLTGASRLAVDVTDRTFDHNILSPLLDSGDLGTLLERTIFAPVEAPLLSERRRSEQLCFPLE